MNITLTIDADEIDHIDACKAARGRLNNIIDQLAEESTDMKYALESLPELIGEHDFKDLCMALGISGDIEFLRKSGRGHEQGEALSLFVRGRVLTGHMEHRQRLADLEAKGLPL